MLNTGETLIPCAQMLDLYMHNICMIILLKTFFWPSVWGWKAVDLVSLVSNNDERLDLNVLRTLLSQSLYDGLWYPEVSPHQFEEYISSGLCYDIFLTSCENDHIRKPINPDKKKCISLLG
jgi:hypothetical protein